MLPVRLLGLGLAGLLDRGLGLALPVQLLGLNPFGCGLRFFQPLDLIQVAVRVPLLQLPVFLVQLPILFAHTVVLRLKRGVPLSQQGDRGECRIAVRGSLPAF